MRIVFVIPARSGSKRLRDKNLRTVGGKPLVRIAVEQAQEAARLRVFDDCDVVACVGGDWDGVQALLSACPKGVRAVVRPDELSQGADAEFCGATYPHGLAAPLFVLEQEAGADVLVLLQPTSPLRSIDDILACIELHCRTGDTVMSCCTPGVPNGAVYVASAPRLLQARSWGMATAQWYVMPRERSVDIDCEIDLDRANAALADA